MTVIDEIAAERCRRIEVEGWSAEHDDVYQSGQLALAAACYTLHGEDNGHAVWPWDDKWWKPTNRRLDWTEGDGLEPQP